MYTMVSCGTYKKLWKRLMKIPRWMIEERKMRLGVEAKNIDFSLYPEKLEEIATQTIKEDFSKIKNGVYYGQT